MAAEHKDESAMIMERFIPEAKKLFQAERAEKWALTPLSLEMEKAIDVIDICKYIPDSTMYRYDAWVILRVVYEGKEIFIMFEKGHDDSGLMDQISDAEDKEEIDNILMNYLFAIIRSGIVWEAKPKPAAVVATGSKELLPQ
ncbi:MAG: hypothetical protein Hyperionvirus2_93 [Hyperionvirus sp.]|uniref:Uncharacterized protein n=1 Tax=Hyperionvirus sp. TaxID=2487770 RepID=A0A3G5A648_9VIRU|nr:MAG: hypothetical protein Hyperionvirus2_93 [Hyperionvirus sp.]